MKFYNYETIYLAARGNPRRMIGIFLERKTKGLNWIINTEFTVETSISYQHKAEYLGLCALRDYKDYISKGYRNLLLTRLPPWIPLEVVKENPLINLTDNEIIFLKENK